MPLELHDIVITWEVSPHTILHRIYRLREQRPYSEWQKLSLFLFITAKLIHASHADTSSSEFSAEMSLPAVTGMFRICTLHS